MRAGHHAAAAPVALGYAYGAHSLGGVSGLGTVPLAVLVVAASTWNDLDHPRFRGKMHFGAALVRGSGRLGYLLRTPKDKARDDVHRGPSHCLEWCLLLGLLVTGLTWRAGVSLGYAPWLGGAVALGTASHIAADVMTPSGVPVSALYSWLRHGEVWRRYSLGWFATDSGGERFLAVPIFYGITTVMGLAMVGALVPLLSALTGWS